jgi:predicted Zn-dependent protease
LTPERKGTQASAILSLLDIGEDDGVEGSIRLLLRDNADSSDLHGYLAVALLRRDKVDEARHEAQLSMRFGGETGSGPWALGNVEMQAKNWNAAVDAFRQEVAAIPGDPIGWLLLTAGLQLAGQTDEAQKSAARLMAMCPRLSASTLRDMANDPYGTQKPAPGYIAARARMIDALEAAGVPSTVMAR